MKNKVRKEERKKFRKKNQEQRKLIKYERIIQMTTVVKFVPIIK